MENVLPLLLGWLLGLLSPEIAERIRRKHRQRDLLGSVLGELVDLQYIIALVASGFRRRQAEETDEFLDWLIPIAQAYDGPNKRPMLAANLERLRQFPEAQRREADLAMQDEGVGVGLPQYGLPFLASQSSELSICPLDFQRRVFRVKGQLDIFNQRIEFLRLQYEKTFDTTIVGSSREAVERNLTNGYRDLGAQAESIARNIGEILLKYGAYRQAA